MENENIVAVLIEIAATLIIPFKIER